MKPLPTWGVVVALSTMPLAMGPCSKKANTSDAGSASSALPATSASAPVATGAGVSADKERESKVKRACALSCEVECEAKDKSDGAYFDGKKAKIPEAPFDVQIDRVWLRGSCAKGDVPEKRESGDGLKVLVEGKVTYKGDDLLTHAELDGVVYLNTGGERFGVLPSEEKSYSYWGGGYKHITKVVRTVRGADPWLKGQAREFHWESKALTEGYCNLKPKEVAVLMEMETFGLATTKQRYTIKHVPVMWDEVLGMAVREKASLRKQKMDDTFVEEPVTVYYSRLDKALIVNAQQKQEWVPHASLVQPTLWKPAAAAPLPAKAESASWVVTVKSIGGAKDFGGFSPTGEDQFLAILDVELEAKAGSDKGKDPKPAKVKSFDFSLETAAGTWRAPLGKAPGQLDGNQEVSVAGKVGGKLVFPRQRFERPFRLEVKTPDRSTLFLEVFSYDHKPERWK